MRYQNPSNILTHTVDQFQRTPVWSCSLKDVSQETGKKTYRSRQVASLPQWQCEDVRGPPCLGSTSDTLGPPGADFTAPSDRNWRFAKLLRMKYPKVPSGAPEYCIPHRSHSTWIWPQWCQLGICDGTDATKTSGYFWILASIIFYLPLWNSTSKEQDPNMARGGPKKKSLDGRGSCSVRQTCTRLCLQNDVKYAWCRSWESKEKERTRKTHTERKRDRERERERKGEREREGEIETDSADQTRVDLRCVGVKSRCEKYVIMRKLHCKRFVGRTLRPALGKYQTTQVSVTRILVQQQEKSEIINANAKWGLINPPD